MKIPATLSTLLLALAVGLTGCAKKKKAGDEGDDESDLIGQILGGVTQPDATDGGGSGAAGGGLTPLPTAIASNP